jgi:hypothetical protein
MGGMFQLVPGSLLRLILDTALPGRVRHRAGVPPQDRPTALDDLVGYYNTTRPHQSLAMATLAARFQPAARPAGGPLTCTFRSPIGRERTAAAVLVAYCRGRRTIT